MVYLTSLNETSTSFNSLILQSSKGHITKHSAISHVLSAEPHIASDKGSTIFVSYVRLEPDTCRRDYAHKTNRYAGAVDDFHQRRKVGHACGRHADFRGPSDLRARAREQHTAEMIRHM